MNPAGLDLLTEVHAQFGGLHETGMMTVAEAVDTLPAQGLVIERWEEGMLVLFRLTRLPPSGRPGA